MAGQTGTVWGGAGQGIGDRGIGDRGIRDRGLGDKGIGGYELMKSNREAVWEVLTQINQVILGKETLTAEVLAALLAGGHVLLEDLPGSGKTTLALALSKLLGLDWKRVQFTPDVLPSDLTGFSIYRKDLQRFVYQPGAVFCNLLLADEINRTSPKTQSALLEVMEEEQVTVEGVTRKVPAPFFVIATQNPTGTAGTQMLPPAQMDHFMICTTMGYPDFASEVEMAKGTGIERRTDHLMPMLNAQVLQNIRQEVEQIFVHDSVYHYIVKLITATRRNPHFEAGASPRGTISLVRMAKVTAWIAGNDFVSPADVSAQFIPVVNHRVRLSTRARMDGVEKENVLAGILEHEERPFFKGR